MSPLLIAVLTTIHVHCPPTLHKIPYTTTPQPPSLYHKPPSPAPLSPKAPTKKKKK